ncbi:MAG: hypothetical protein ACLRSW_15015 [Christensenellaceae bacterium]
MKEADCAVSVASGSDAARNVSNLVLQDNNFGSMPKIVNEGRRVINNIKDSASLYIMKTLLTMLLALVCIFTGSAYFFTTNNMLMFEVLISAIPSIVLSLQPNTNRVSGNLSPSSSAAPCRELHHGFRNSRPLYHQSDSSPFEFTNAAGETEDPFITPLMMSLTFTGLVMLFHLSAASILFARHYSFA